MLCVLHEDSGPLELGLEGMAVIRVASKRFGPHDEVALDCAGNAQLGALAFNGALHALGMQLRHWIFIHALNLAL